MHGEQFETKYQGEEVTLAGIKREKYQFYKAEEVLD